MKNGQLMGSPLSFSHLCAINFSGHLVGDEKVPGQTSESVNAHLGADNQSNRIHLIRWQVLCAFRKGADQSTAQPWRQLQQRRAE